MAKYTAQQIKDNTDVDTVFAHYVTAQIWTGLFEPGEDQEPVELDSKMVNGAEDIDAETMAKMRADVESFCKDVRRILRSYAVRESLSAEQLGHDFSLTRNHHGAGFWDRGWGKLGETLTKAAHAYGASSLYGFPDESNVETGLSFELTS